MLLPFLALASMFVAVSIAGGHQIPQVATALEGFGVMAAAEHIHDWSRDWLMPTRAD